MKKEQIIILKDQMTKHKKELETRYPISKLVLSSIEALLQMDADDSFIRSWYSGQMKLIRNIQNILEDIEKR